jgi:hypothetical protein
MKYGIALPLFDAFFDSRLVAELASDAENVGWDGFFVWDHVLLWPTPIADPWVTLAAIALKTERIRLGPMVTPLPRRRPIKLAREAVTLDHLSSGRLILGVGIGDGPWEWDYLGEEPDQKRRGEMLDEGLDLITRLWTGEPYFHHGHYYRYHGDAGPADPTPGPTPFLPAPRQSPRIPIWVAGNWPNRPPFRRAARWDGVLPQRRGANFGQTLAPIDLAEVVGYVRARRATDQPFDVVVAGHTFGESVAADAGKIQPYAEAGATWWFEDISPWPFGWNWNGPWPVEAMIQRVRRGPPRRLSGG